LELPEVALAAKYLIKLDCITPSRNRTDGWIQARRALSHYLALPYSCWRPFSRARC